MCRSKGVVIIAKLCLGTVQFGMHYGIHNVLGRQPTDEEVFSILDTALAHGICEYDTASAYGTAEDILGRYGLAQKSINSVAVRITSKLYPDTANDEESVLGEIRKSLRRLHAESIHCYMLHRADDMERPAIMKGLVRAKKEGVIESIGVSVYAPEEALRAIQNPHIEIVQVPYNALDQRLDSVGFFEKARAHGRRIYTRSSFLQGLLLMNPKEAEMRVKRSGAYVTRFQEIAETSGFLPEEAAMLYVLSHPGIDAIVFGVDTVEQLEKNMCIADKLGTFQPCREKICDAFADVPEEIVVPSLW